MKQESKKTLLFRGGKIVLPDRVLDGDLAVEGEQISAILERNSLFCPRDCQIVDVSGMLLFPGLIDPHVHMWDPSPFNYREDWFHGSRCAASGGITTIIDMPLSVPPVADPESLRQKLLIAQKNSCVDFSFWGGLIPSCLDQLEKMNDSGCVAYKGFMSFANPKYPQITDGYLAEGMKIAARFDGLIGLHAENAEVADFGSRRMADSGETDPARHDEARPWWAELEAIQRACLFSKALGNRLYICHMTIAQGADYLKKSKSEGLPVFVETCPHYLIFDKTILREKGAYAKCNPPFRSRENVEKLWEAVFDGTIDTIGSDHGPYLDQEKEQEGNFFKELCGFGGFDAMFPALLTEGLHKRGLKPERLAQLLSGNAAKIMGLFPQKGSLLPGADADLVIVDPAKEWVYDNTRSFSKTPSKHNIYHGMHMKGKVKRTYVRGTCIFCDDSVAGKAGYGRYIPKKI